MYVYRADSGVIVYSSVKPKRVRLQDKYKILHIPVSYSLWARKVWAWLTNR